MSLAVKKIISVAAAGIGATATLAGFTAQGIAAGSFAAAVQSTIGSVSAGSGFAAMQSFGALGGFFGMMLSGMVSSAFFWWFGRAHGG